MGSYVLRGITTALLITVLTLFAGIAWSSMGLQGLSISQLIDIGLLASCLIGGYRTAKESKLWFLGGVTGAGYVAVGTLLLALFLPIRVMGFIQVLAEGTLIGLVAGAFGAGNSRKTASVWNERRENPDYALAYAGYGKDAGDNNYGRDNNYNKYNYDRDNNYDSDSDNDWDREEEYVPRFKTSGPKWLEGTDGELPESPRTTSDSVVEWPWDREPAIEYENRNTNQTATTSKYANKNSYTDTSKNNYWTETTEPRFERNDIVVRSRGEEQAKPWWE
ncbi:TIGR04086 family membrane protein [Desulfosporosinus hippei]|uniref:Uncharacterized protein n=1 Tax=Desulfosporosinus hippei DSM 8344 TaxID=1121419 RepID=A0A1G8F0B1_9FIRM|nr:TIGR04086 family membrane protein [Desulfosporosinus hippei]SDH75560.1 hypothetical protein SAMN05443529_11859 [Desulfosporosinus hippei DSM 8344]